MEGPSAGGMEGGGDHCEDLCLCNPCQCQTCPKNMRAQLSVRARSYDPSDHAVVDIL